ncbi:hypothetical protein MRB53_031330 [Persea americana]|uniref:Uncharacterized protein n=1 Tax=Persea americana TaxID=3435 RepID=A0ACC2KNU2_PERAE|nr:hypothetical protein MRB53_031330 [Persea americana]
MPLLNIVLSQHAIVIRRKDGHFHTTSPSLSLLLFLIVCAIGGGDSLPLFPTTDLIYTYCDVSTDDYDLCVSSLLACPHNASVVYLEIGKLAFCAAFDNATGTRQQLGKLIRGSSLDPASKRTLRNCGEQYDMAIYRLALADNCIKSKGFEYKYKPVLYSVQFAQDHFTKCEEMLKRKEGLVEPFRQKTEIVRRTAENAHDILSALVV